MAALALPACDDTVVRLFVVADLAVPSEVDGLVVTVTGGGEEASSRYPLSESASSLRESVTLLPGAKMRGELQIDVVGLLQERAVASGGGEGAFQAGAVAEVIVTLSPIVPTGDGGVSDAGPDVVDAGPVVVDAGPRDCLDDDGDGYGDGPGCLGFDCDEADDDVHEGAEELCNDVDDDCDFGVDEGCECPLGQGFACGTLRGQCEIGVQVCTTGTWSECDSATPPEREECDGEDNDCDGDVDEGCP